MNLRSCFGVLGVAISFGSTSCNGYLEGSAGPEVAVAGPVGSSAPGAASPAVPAVLPSGCDAKAPLRRLTNFEYQNTLRDLFPSFDLGPLADALPGDAVERALVFDNQAAYQGVTAQHVDGYGKVAERVAALVTADAKLTGCEPASGTDACFEAFLKPFATRAFRRPPTDAELSRIMSTFSAVKATLGFQEAERAAIERVLQSPQFLYRLELDSLPASGKATRLSPWELASRLSYLVWGSMPDAELLASAQSGALASPEGLMAQTRRLLADSRARPSFDHLFEQWLGLRTVPSINKDMQRFPRFNTEVARLLAEETRTFLERVLLDGEGGFEQLFSARFTYANRSLADYYGLTGPRSDSFEKVPLPAGRAGGILAQGAFGALYATDKTTHPIKRGAFIRTRVLCDALPAPPANVPPAPMFTGTETARELLAKHRAAPGCAACHDLIDGIGLGLENLDAAGQWREVDVDGMPVNAEGDVIQGADAGGSFVGVGELGTRLGKSEKVRTCLARQLFRYGLGRDAGDGDRCALSSMAAPTTSAAEPLDYATLVLRLVASDAFQARTN